MTTDQRIIMAARIYEKMVVKSRSERAKRGHLTRKNKSARANDNKPRLVQIIATEFGITTSQLWKGITLHRKRPELSELVIRGIISLNKANGIMREDAKMNEPTEQTPPQVAKLANKLTDAIGQIIGITLPERERQEIDDIILVYFGKASGILRRQRKGRMENEETK